MPHEELNPFAAPRARHHLSQDSDWELTTLRNGLNLLFWSLCAGTVIHCFWFLSVCFWGANPLPLGLRPTLLVAAKLGGFAVGIASLIASFYLFHSSPTGKTQRLSVLVLILAGLTPTVAYIFPILAREVAGGQILGWIVNGVPAFRFLLNCALLMLLRLIAIQFQQRTAERIAGPAILLALAAALLPFTRPSATTVQNILAVFFASAAVVSILKGIVVYILLVHVKTLTSGTPKTEVG